MKTDNVEITTEHASAFQDNRLALGGTLAFCILATIQFLATDSLSPLAKFAVGCFAVAIPLLAVNISLLTLELGYKTSCRPWYIWWSTGIGIGTGLIGTAATFFTFYPWAGIIFILATTAGGTIMYGFIDRLQKLNPEESKDK